jgi:hypothetical protein
MIDKILAHLGLPVRKATPVSSAWYFPAGEECLAEAKETYEIGKQSGTATNK